MNLLIPNYFVVHKVPTRNHNEIYIFAGKREAAVKPEKSGCSPPIYSLGSFAGFSLQRGKKIHPSHRGVIGRH